MATTDPAHSADTAEPQFCDNCGNEWDGFAAYSEVPVDVASANEGESAILCRSCCEQLGLQHNDGNVCGPEQRPDRTLWSACEHSEQVEDGHLKGNVRGAQAVG